MNKHTMQEIANFFNEDIRKIGYLKAFGYGLIIDADVISDFDNYQINQTVEPEGNEKDDK